jgi:ubiquitin-like 1-activating enzyme E1 B
MWGSKPKKPVALSYEELKDMKPSAAIEGNGLPEQKVWDLKENFDMFGDSVTRLSTRLLKDRESQKDAILSFDKDDEDAMDFVTAASNLRAYVYGIEKKSLFDVKCKSCGYSYDCSVTNSLFS